MLEKCSVDCSVGATEPSTRRSMKLTVMETSSRMAIHQEWSEGANFGIGVISFCFTIYRGIREKVTLQLPIRRSSFCTQRASPVRYGWREPRILEFHWIIALGNFTGQFHWTISLDIFS